MENLRKAGNIMLRLGQAQRRRRSKTKKANAHSLTFNPTGVIDRMSFTPLLWNEMSCKLQKDQETKINEALNRAREILKIKRQYNYILPFPFNVLTGFIRIESEIKRCEPNAELRMYQDTDRIRLAVKHRFNTSNTLFYIPVLPLYLLLRQNKKCGELLVAVCSYLVRCAGIPFYRDRSTYICWEYEMLKEWVMENPDDWGPDDFKLQSNEIRASEVIGDIIGRKIYSHAPLERLPYLIQSFKPQDTYESECKNLGIMALNLWKCFPKMNFFRNMVPSVDVEQDEGWIAPEQYISFVHRFDSWLGDMLFESINNQLNEYRSIAEPEAFNFLDTAVDDPQKIDYDIRLFALINRLCSLL